MININFEVSKAFLAYQILTNTEEGYIKGVKKLKEKAWASDEETYKKIKQERDIDKLKFDEIYNNFFNSMIKNRRFNILFEELKRYSKKMIKYWEENKDCIESYMKEVLRINPDITLTAYISHPYINTGRYIDEHKIIEFGHYKGIKNPDYNLVYLFHESMHEIMIYNYDWEIDEIDINHAIIELASDYELYYRKTGKSRLNGGHEHLQSYREAIYPYWLLYLGLTEEEMKQRMDFDNNHFDIEAYIEYKDNLSKMNIYEFRNFCFEHVKVDEQDKSEGQK